jgi:excinuclease ABC subunit A
VPALDKKFKHDLAVVVDRLVLKADLRKRLPTPSRRALRSADGLRRDRQVDGPSSSYSERFACPEHGVSLPELAAAHLLVQLAARRLPACTGLGASSRSTPSSSCPTRARRSPRARWRLERRTSTFYDSRRQAIADRWEVDVDRRGRAVRASTRSCSCTAPATTVYVTYKNRWAQALVHDVLRGHRHDLARRYRETESPCRGADRDYMSHAPVPDLQGRAAQARGRSRSRSAAQHRPVHAASVHDALAFLGRASTCRRPSS